jgi:hypothetical protein
MKIKYAFIFTLTWFYASGAIFRGPLIKSGTRLIAEKVGRTPK